MHSDRMERDKSRALGSCALDRVTDQCCFFTFLSRSVIPIDTDVLLYVIVEERHKRRQLEEQIRELVAEVRQQSTSKARRRFNKLIQDIGVHLDDELDGEAKQPPPGDSAH